MMANPAAALRAGGIHAPAGVAVAKNSENHVHLVLPPRSPSSRPLRVASSDGLRPALTSAVRNGCHNAGRDGEPVLN
jgi:hypothetical protein